MIHMKIESVKASVEYAVQNVMIDDAPAITYHTQHTIENSLNQPDKWLLTLRFIDNPANPVDPLGPSVMTVIDKDILYDEDPKKFQSLLQFAIDDLKKLHQELEANT